MPVFIPKIKPVPCQAQRAVISLSKRTQQILEDWRIRQYQPWVTVLLHYLNPCSKNSNQNYVWIEVQSPMRNESLRQNKTCARRKKGERNWHINSSRLQIRQEQLHP